MEKVDNSLKRINDTSEKSRRVLRVVDSVQTLEGEGFLVHRSFPTRQLPDIDPFMLLDEMGPMDLAPGEAKGAPDHPHRGFETVTYLLEGKFEHKDSRGNSGKLGPGDVQWMTAGAGVIHSEMPEREFARQGGRLHGFQLWVNLPRRDKMIEPRYQEIKSLALPTAETADGKVRVKVIAGESLGKRAAIETRTPIAFLHFTLKPGGSISQPLKKNYNAFVYVVEGSGSFGHDGKSARKGRVVVFENEGDSVSVRVPDDATSELSLLLIGGIPLKEPVVRYGPFVMNSDQEINQAIEDYRSGRMGTISHGAENSGQ